MQSIDVFGLKLSVFTLEQVSAFYGKVLDEGSNVVIFGHSFGSIPVMKNYPDLVDIVNSFDILVCDGTLFHWYCNFFGFKLQEVMSIPAITNYTLTYADHHKLSVLLLGAKEQINHLARERLAKRYPNATFLRGINGYFTEVEEENMVRMISSQAPDVLLIGISTPGKENFAYKYRNNLNASIIIPCGGMIDVYSGKTKQTPFYLKKIGLASLYRFVQEPKRLINYTVWIIYETFFIIIPLTFWNVKIKRRKSFNLITEYFSI